MACQQVYLPYHTGACMPLYLQLPRLLHLLSLTTQFAVPIYSFCLHVQSSTSILVYFPTYSLCVAYSLHCLISLPVNCWSLPIACLLYMAIQFTMPMQSSKCSIYAPMAFYPCVASFSNIRSILSNRAYSIKIALHKTQSYQVLNFAKIK